MQLDFQQFLMKLEKLTDIRPIPDKEFVETYIKAYYLTENDMERWIKEHRVRTERWCLSLGRSRAGKEYCLNISASCLVSFHLFYSKKEIIF